MIKDVILWTIIGIAAVAIVLNATNFSTAVTTLGSGLETTSANITGSQASGVNAKLFSGIPFFGGGNQT